MVMTTRAIGYVRVSTDDQVREGVSLDVQETRIRAYCEAKSWQLVSVVRDEGKSAKDLKRPGLQEILGALPKRQRCFDVLVVVKLDRLTRSVRDLGNLIDAFKRARVGFTSIQESVDTASASGELFFNLVASVSQWERRAIGERTLSAMAHLRAQGRRISRQPRFGVRFDAAGRVEPDPREQATLSKILQLRETGLSLRAISTALAGQPRTLLPTVRLVTALKPSSLQEVWERGRLRWPARLPLQSSCPSGVPCGQPRLEQVDPQWRRPSHRNGWSEPLSPTRLIGEADISYARRRDLAIVPKTTARRWDPPNR